MTATPSKRVRFFTVRNAVLALAILVGAAVVFATTAPPTFGRAGLLLDEAHVHGAVVAVGLRSDARIADLLVEEGQRVAAGTLLATADSAHLEARVASAEAAVARAEAELLTIRERHDLARRLEQATLRRAEAARVAASAERDAAAASLTLAERTHERRRALVADQALAQDQLDRARETLETARAELRQREADLGLARAEVERARIAAERDPVRSAELAVAEAGLATAQAGLTESRADLEAAEIRAPAAARVVAIHARPGSSVRPRDPVLTLWLEDAIWVRAWVEEDRVDRIRTGMAARIEVPDGSDVAHRGVVSAILVAPHGRERSLPGTPASPLLPDETRFAVRIAIEDPKADALLPGRSVRVRLLDDDADLRTPSEASAGITD